MGDISRVQVFDAALGAAHAGVQAWGVSQRQRRVAEYNKAIAETREAYRQLYQDIQHENDYTQHQAMFDSGVEEIRKTVGDTWLSDPWVRNKYDQQWDGITQSARETAMNYSEAAERTALQVEMFNQIKTFYQASLENAHANTRGIISQYYEEGIIGPREREEAWQYYRKVGQSALETRVKAAVEARNDERVLELYETAVGSGIIEDPKLAADMQDAALYEIQIGVAEDVALATYLEGGIEAATDWVMDPNNMSELDFEDQARVRRFLMEHVRLRQSEEERVARKADEAFMQQVQEYESQIIAGDATWTEGIAFLNSKAAKDNLLPRNWQGQMDRFRVREAQAARDAAAGGGVGGPTDTQLANALMTKFRIEMDEGADYEDIRERVTQAGLDYRLSYNQVDELLTYNVERGENSREMTYIEAILADTIAAQRKEGNINAEFVEFASLRIKEDLLGNLQALSVDPQGNPLSEEQIRANIQNFIVPRITGGEYTEKKLLGLFERDLPNPAILENAQDKAYYGFAPARVMRQAVNNPQELEGEAFEDYINEILFSGIAAPTAIQKNRIATVARLAAVNREAEEAYVEDFEVQPVDVGVGVDGIAYFFRIEDDPDSDGTVSRPYRREVDENGNYVWKGYHSAGKDGRGGWIRHNPVKEREEAEADEERREAYWDSRPELHQQIEGLQSTPGTPTPEGTAYADAYADTAEGQPDEDEVNHLAIGLLAQPMTYLKQHADMAGEDQTVWDRVHKTLIDPAYGVTLNEWDEIRALITTYRRFMPPFIEDKPTEEESQQAEVPSQAEHAERSPLY